MELKYQILILLYTLSIVNVFHSLYIMYQLSKKVAFTERELKSSQYVGMIKFKLIISQFNDKSTASIIYIYKKTCKISK